jgi:hypothetical protein
MAHDLRFLRSINLLEITKQTHKNTQILAKTAPERR